MLVISAAQFGQLQDAADEAFIKAESEHLARYDPTLAGSAGGEGLKAAARLGLHAARACGWTEGAQVRLYLQLMTSFGSRFDTDMLYAWLHPYLDSRSDLPARERSRLLHWHATRYIDQAYGEKGLYAIAAGERAARLDMGVLADVGQDLQARAPALLARMHPQRNPFLQADAGPWLIEKSAAEARRFGLAGAAAAPLLMCLMFSFGHGVADDPLYPWVRQTLVEPTLDAESRTAALLANAQARLAEMLKDVRGVRR